MKLIIQMIKLACMPVAVKSRKYIVILQQQKLHLRIKLTGISLWTCTKPGHIVFIQPFISTALCMHACMHVFDETRVPHVQLNYLHKCFFFKNFNN